MNPYVLSCCSTADMPPSFFAQRQIPYVCFHFTLDGVEYPDDLGHSISFDDFYSRIKAGASPTTSQVNPMAFAEFFIPFLEAGQDILHVSFSSGLSGSYAAACITRDELATKYPDRKIYVIDSLAASGGYGLLMEMAADLRDGGATIDEAYAWLEEHRLNLHHWFFSTDLSHYKRGGRISATSAALGTLLNICPLLNVSADGKLTPITKVRGTKNVMKAMLDRMKQLADGRLEYVGKCVLTHSAFHDCAREVANMVESTFPNMAQPVMINSIGTVIGSHTGPGTIALFFYGDKRID